MIYLYRDTFHGDPGGLVIEGESGTRLEFTYKVLRLWEMDPTAILAMGSPGLCPLVPLMAGKPEELVVKSQKKICAAPESAISPDDKGELLYMMATLVARVLEDPEMYRQLLEELSRDTKNPAVNLLREQGRRQGKAEGALEEARCAVLHALECRFGRPSPDLAENIRRISSLEKLKALLEKAILAPRIEAFLESLK